MLIQYLVLEKRFGLVRRVSSSRWGTGISERVSLHGENRGYPLSLYRHYLNESGGKTEWTSLVFEALFAGCLEFSIEYSGTQERSRFPESTDFVQLNEDRGCRIWISDSAAADVFQGQVVNKWMAAFGEQPSCGCVRLSKGFLEYREWGVIETEDQRLRFQEAIVLLASLCDALSVYMSQSEAGR